MTKRSHYSENKENEFDEYVSINSFISKSSNENLLRPIKKAKIFQENFLSQIECSNDEEHEPISIGTVLLHYDGSLHSKYKQYIIYENIESTLISKTARFWCRKYLKVLLNVDPDSYDMYIHNDFVCYGEFEIIENCIMDIAKGIYLKYGKQMTFTNYIFAFRRFEALTILLHSSKNFFCIDDDFRFIGFMRLIGACYVTTLRGLLPKAMFNDEPLNDDDIKKLNKIAQQLPNFKQVIKQTLIIGHYILLIGKIQTAYINILQTIYCKWSLLIDQISIDLNSKRDQNDETLWEAMKHAASIKKTIYGESYNFLKEFEQYTKNNPDFGRNSHDLRKWSKARIALFTFDNNDDDDDEDKDEYFWYRL